ncbi:hypothetical protein [Tenggerimyces flavus]|uniref:Adhesin domain-containing protein n=1 Tax=Tenggerimyces flavus TaxID=1708749 RepID=A0ABV7Y6G9_9ACTN|nr:hypothetical protein [Tenggerimyces flavus]MBM7791109.1 cell division septum initiation protein DivIVA [Tenggerimyces flavus]
MPENSKGPETDLWAEVTDSVRSAAASAAEVAQAAAAKAQSTADDLQAKAEEIAQKFQDKADEAQEKADEAPGGPAQDTAQEEADRVQEEADAAAERAQEFADSAQEEADEAQEAADEVEESEDVDDGEDEAALTASIEAEIEAELGATADDVEEEATATPGTTASPDEQIRSILAMVADGSIDPDSAAKLIDEVKAGAASVGDDPKAKTKTQTKTDGAKPADTPPANPVAATKLRVRAVGRRVRIIGEPFVSTVAIDGPHVIRQEGDTLIVTSEGEFGASLDGFQLLRSRSLSEVPERVFGFGRELSIRVNPRLLVEAEITAGSINTERLPSLEQVRVTAGSAKIRDVEGPIDVLVQAGSAQVEGRISRGESRLRAESGSVTLHLWPGSNVRIKPDIQLGQVKWEPPGKDRKEHIVGAGDAKLSLEVMMGAATVREAL